MYLPKAFMEVMEFSGAYLLLKHFFLVPVLSHKTTRLPLPLHLFSEALVS